MAQEQGTTSSDVQKTPLAHKTVSLLTFKGIGFALCFLLIIGIGSLELINISKIGSTANNIREDRLPVFVENNKTLVNIESLRGLANIARVSDDPLLRRKARINAFALSAESLFGADNTFRVSSRQVAEKIKQMVERRDVITRLHEDIDKVGKAYMESFGRLLGLSDAEFGVHIMESLYNGNPIVLGRFGLPEYFAIEGKSAFLAEKTLRVAEIIKMLEQMHPDKKDMLAEVKMDITKALASYVNTADQVEMEQRTVDRLADVIDIDLRTMRDQVTVGSEVAIAHDLESIIETARETSYVSLGLYSTLLAGVLLYFYVLHIFITKPLRWTSAKLAALQDGDTVLTPPKIYITEIAHLASLLDMFSVHLADIYLHANQLEEDVAEKRDIEELMHAVFKASLDGYIVWDEQNILRVSMGFPELLEFVSTEEMLDSWQLFGRSPDALKLLSHKVYDKQIAREELVLHTASGKLLPVEATHLPILFHDKHCVLSYIRDLTQQKIHEEALLFAKEQAEVATKAKGDFLARMSHEIRTPMNGVLGLTHIALESDPPAKQRELLNKIQSSAKVLLGVINDILDFSKIEDGKLALEQSAFSLTEVFDTIRNMLEAQAQKKGINLLFDVEEKALGQTVVVGDSLRLTQILMNLCGNGIKFTESGAVTLSAKVVSSAEHTVTVRFGVQDTGIGLTEEQIGKLFKPFVQVDTSTTRKYGGTGLGLMISKLLVELMGGTLEVSSSLGQGSEFFFVVNFEQVTQNAGVFEADTQRTDVSSLTGRHVLVAEDNDINQEIILSLLENFGMNVTIAGNGQEAVALAEAKDFDIIFMDIQMPVMDGLSAASAIRRSDKQSLRSVPMVAMTAHVLQEDVAKSLDVGMNAHLTKPINVAELEKCLLMFLSPQ